MAKIKPILLILACTLSNAAGQYFLSNGVRLSNYISLGIGIMTYGLSFFFLVSALKFGNLTLIYPFVSLTYIWVLLVSKLLLREPVSGSTAGSVALIILGVVLITGGDR